MTPLVIVQYKRLMSRYSPKMAALPMMLRMTETCFSYYLITFHTEDSQ